jgi:hypothetical protein
LIAHLQVVLARMTRLSEELSMIPKLPLFEGAGAGEAGRWSAPVGVLLVPVVLRTESCGKIVDDVVATSGGYFLALQVKTEEMV